MEDDERIDFAPLGATAEGNANWERAKREMNTSKTLDSERDRLLRYHATLREIASGEAFKDLPDGERISALQRQAEKALYPLRWFST